MNKSVTPFFRMKVYQKFNGVCVFCETNKRLQIHHINTNRSDNRLCNLLLVCDVCHRKAHGRKTYPERFEEAIGVCWKKGFSISAIAKFLMISGG